MDDGLSGKVALVTGTGSQNGMGKAIALTLAKEGCDIVSWDIDLAGAQQTADAVKALGPQAAAFKADVTKMAEVDAAAKASLAQFPRIDILVNTAGGIALGGGSFFEQKGDTWQRDINLNVYGTMNVCRAIMPVMVARKYGKVVNFASIAAKTGGISSYSVAKAGVVTVTRGLASTYGPDNVNVNAIAPGVVETNFFAEIPPDRRKQMFAGMAERVPLRRLQTVEDIANAVAFLVSDVSRNITGQCLQVDSGLVMY